MKQVWAVTVIVFAVSSGPLRAQCASTVATTGLGNCIDFLLATSETLTDQTMDLVSNGFTFQWGSASYTDFGAKNIVIHLPDCASMDADAMRAKIAYVAHELGHGVRGRQEDTSSREAYVESWCDNEGYAVINNIVGREEIKVCSSNTSDIGIAASNPAQLLTLYNEGGNVARTVGSAFCDNNVESVSGKTYREYYGDQYDELYGD